MSRGCHSSGSTTASRPRSITAVRSRTPAARRSIRIRGGYSAKIRRAQRHRGELDHRDAGRHAHARAQPRPLHAAAEQPHAVQARREHLHVLRRSNSARASSRAITSRRSAAAGATRGRTSSRLAGAATTTRAAARRRRRSVQLVAVPFTPTYAEYIYLKGRTRARRPDGIPADALPALEPAARAARAARSPRRRGIALGRARAYQCARFAQINAASIVRSGARCYASRWSAVGTRKRRGRAIGAPRSGRRPSSRRLRTQVFEPRVELARLESSSPARKRIWCRPRRARAREPYPRVRRVAVGDGRSPRASQNARDSESEWCREAVLEEFAASRHVLRVPVGRARTCAPRAARSAGRSGR